MDPKKLPKSRFAAGITASLIGAALLVLVGGTSPAFADCGFKAGDPAKGKKIYNETCIACHGENGTGLVPGAPDFTKKGGALSKPHQVITEHIKNGFREPGKPLAMPPKGGMADLTDKDIQDVHAYLHDAFGCG